MPRAVEKSCFTTHDGVPLVYRRWPAASGTPRSAVLLFHRGHEYGGRIAHLANELDLPDFEFYALDGRGYSPSFAASVRDVQDFVDHLAARHGVRPENTAVIAQSVGAAIAATWAHDYAPRLRAMVLASPAFEVKLRIPFARLGLRLLQKIRGNFLVKPHAIAVNILIEMHDTARRVVDDAQAITIPTQLLISEADVVARRKPQHDFFARLGAATKERHVFPGLFDAAIGKARRFIVDRFDAPLETVDLRDADRSGYTRAEAERVASPLPAFSLRGLFWAAYRAGVALGSWLSRGMALGRKTGFDSGSTLDYVYRNQPTGFGPLGRLLDRSYLDAVGWRGIRQRKLHLEELIQRATRRLDDEGKPTRVVDIAAGHGRYAIDALAAAPRRPQSVLLRDYCPINVAAGRRLIAERGLSDVASFERADAFERDSIAAIAPKPTLGVVSGLYELFPDNGCVRRSLDGLAAAIPPGGYLVYTGQPWHPQLEMIARTLTSHRDGRPWVMRRRTQAEIDQLVAEAGFRKIEQRIDEWGIFTVSLAVREPVHA
jgi:alpha-beta hydrolase superfamily lysophospholipase